MFWVDPANDLTVLFLTQKLFNDARVLPLRAQLTDLIYKNM